MAFAQRRGAFLKQSPPAVGAVTVTPDTVALVLASFAPTVTATANQVVTPNTATLTLTAFAPVINLTVIPGTASLITTAFAPTVTASNNQTVIPATAALVTSAFAPTVTATNNQTATPATAVLTLATFAPTVTGGAGLTVTPDTAALTTQAFAPSVTATDNKTVIPDVAALVLTTFAPIVTGGQGLTLTPDTATLTLTTFVPDVTATGTAAEEAVQPVPAGAPARDVRRRRYIMPDGRMVLATTQEALDMLRMYSVPKEAIAQLTALPTAQPVIRAPQIVLERRDVRFVPDEQPNTYRAVISERFVYRAPAEAYRQAEIMLNRMRDDEEALLLLL